MFDGKSGNEKAPQRRDFLHYLLRIRTEDDLVVGAEVASNGKLGFFAVYQRKYSEFLR